MDSAVLRQRLADIIREEESADVDWNVVDLMCAELSEDLSSQTDTDCPHIVFHFLSDSDIRAKDSQYGQAQRVEIKRFVETGECNDSRPVSRWSCLAVLAVIAALVVWLLS